ncbi:bcl-2-related ovarian killer protein-like [Huso huso]|uniref:Bcl-2-related ovarian killer protein-like n=1 Tax=Huso huso TaxID=61971 RepID=A0ABR0Z7W5_HUSHU
MSASGEGLTHADPVVREAYLMSHDYISYVTGMAPASRPAPSKAAAALRHAGDELLLKYPIFFKRWPRLFQELDGGDACDTLLRVLDEHFTADRAAGRQLTWSAILSIYVLAGQMALHCQESGMGSALPELQRRVGEYVERVVCPQIREKGGWSGFLTRYSKKQDPEQVVIRVCCASLLLFTSVTLSYYLWKRKVS